jgi:hypothetical protein
MAGERNRRALVASADPRVGAIAVEPPAPPRASGFDHDPPPDDPHVVPGSPTALYRRLTAGLEAQTRDTVEALLIFTAVTAIVVAFLVVNTLERAAQDPWDSSSAKAWAFLIVTVAVIVGANWAVGRACDRALARADGSAPSALDDDVARRAIHRSAAVAAVVGVAVVALAAFPVVHGVLILLYVYPLVTWLPLIAVYAVVLAATAIGAASGHAPVAGARAALSWRMPVLAAAWLAAMVVLPSLQGRALYEATTYRDGAVLPRTTQPRLLPKDAAKGYANAAGLRDAHLVLDPVSDSLSYSAEHKTGSSPTGASDGIALQPLDEIDGTLERRPSGFRTAVSAVGPGSLSWRAYRRHPFTRVLERVIVPLEGGRAVAVAPYIGFKGFPVRHPFWQGVYVLHQDGRLEDLSPRAAIARPELARSGHLFPETLARDIAEAYGYRAGAFARPAGRTVVSDPSADSSGGAGNPQPYLTNLGDGLIDWVTVAHPASDDDVVTAVFLTDAVTGTTRVWHAPRGRVVLSNRGAIALARGLHLQWDTGSVLDDEQVEIRRAVEPRPVFARGRLYYLVSILPENGLHTAHRVDRTVLVDAVARRVVRVFDHADPEADDALRDFFAAGP